MTPAVSAVVVTHRSASEAAACVASLRAAFEAEGIAGETVVVDCGSGEEEANLLRGIAADELVLLPDNRGYSGGVNAGLERARGATVLLCNADVVFLPGAVRELAAAVEERRVGAAAPLCLWDSAGLLRLPADPPSGLAAELGLVRFAPFARRTLSLWQRGGEARRLVGAVLAARREVFDRVGGFDESFPFEYEETDWEIRVRRAGFALRFHPAARVRHLYARSAARNPETEARRAASRRLFRSRYYGAVGRAVIESAERADDLAAGGANLRAGRARAARRLGRRLHEPDARPVRRRSARLGLPAAGRGARVASRRTGLPSAVSRLGRRGPRNARVGEAVSGFEIREATGRRRGRDPAALRAGLRPSALRGAVALEVRAESRRLARDRRRLRRRDRRPLRGLGRELRPRRRADAPLLGRRRRHGPVRPRAGRPARRVPRDDGRVLRRHRRSAFRSAMGSRTRAPCA